MMRRDWFDARDRGHWVWLVFGLAFGAASVFGLTMTGVERRLAPVLRVVEITPQSDRLNLGDLFVVDLIVEKFRDDCENGRLIRHMNEINRGWFYEVERIDAVQLPVGVHPLNLVIPTKPLDPTRGHLMRPGLWQIISRVTYDCPDGDGGALIERDYKFRTPAFTILDE